MVIVASLGRRFLLTGSRPDLLRGAVRSPTFLNLVHAPLEVVPEEHGHDDDLRAQISIKLAAMAIGVPTEESRSPRNCDIVSSGLVCEHTTYKTSVL